MASVMMRTTIKPASMMEEIAVDLTWIHNTAQSVNVLNEKGKARIQKPHLEDEKEKGSPQYVMHIIPNHCKLIIFCGWLLNSDILNIPNQLELILYTQYPIIRNSLIRNSAEFLWKFKKRALGRSNLRNASKNLRNDQCSDF